MTNKEIAKVFDFYSKLLILHEANSFKVRSYQNSYNTIRQISDDLIDMNVPELMAIPGIGKSIAARIVELKEKNTFEDLNDILDITPKGIVEMMKIKGIGPKKIRLIWKELGVESLGELEYAINENRLTLLKGFGKKTQENILAQIEFLNSVKGFLVIDKAERISEELLKKLRAVFTDEKFEITGDLRRSMPIISRIEILTTIEKEKIFLELSNIFDLEGNKHTYKGVEILFLFALECDFFNVLFKKTGPEYFVDLLIEKHVDSEEQLFISNNMTYVPPVFRDAIHTKKDAEEFYLNDFVEVQDIRGVIHNHTIWSDGANSILEMANYYKDKGYEYMVVTDHSKSAFYANGVRIDQMDYYLDDIKNANKSISDFTIFSGIESDILIDGNLDYREDILVRFDLVIASVHSVLRMDKDKATERLLVAIKNPYTKILGHMTGRILLAREGYPLDYNRIFEACAKHNVAIELNANPHRLDIDWSLIRRAQEFGIGISINPDAHNKTEVEYLKYGVLMAQKGKLLKSNCINIKNVEEFKVWLEKSA